MSPQCPMPKYKQLIIFFIRCPRMKTYIFFKILFVSSVLTFLPEPALASIFSRTVPFLSFKYFDCPFEIPSRFPFSFPFSRKESAQPLICSVSIFTTLLAGLACCYDIINKCNSPCRHTFSLCCLPH